MLKKVIIIIITLLMFCSCGAYEETPEDIHEEILFEEPKEEKQEEPEIKEEIPENEPAEEVENPENKPEEETENQEKTEPILEDFSGMKMVKGEETSEKDFAVLGDGEKAFLYKLLQPENWTEYPKDRESLGELGTPTQILTSEGKGTLYIGLEGDETVIMFKWGKGQKYTKKYLAPKEVAYDAEIFREKLLLSKERFESVPETPEEYVEYFDKYIGMASYSLRYDFNEEEYIDGVNAYHLLAFAYIKYTGKDIYEDPESDDLLYPEEFVLEYIQKYFLWDVDDIRRNVRENEFDRETGLYYFPGGYGGGYFPPTITDVRQNGKILEIDVAQYGDADYDCDYRLENFYTVTIRLDDDGTWKYLSRKTYYTVYS